jgi:hypothetical protein
MRASFLAVCASLALLAAASFDDADVQELIARGAIVDEDSDDLEARWQDITVGIGMQSPVPRSSIEHVERAVVSESVAELRTRDGERLEVMLERDIHGGLKIPRNWEEAKQLAVRGVEPVASHIKRSGAARLAKRGFRAIITWYTGHDLLNPSCVSHSGWHPTDNSLASALTINWPGSKPKCGDFIKVRAKNSNKSIIVRVVDSCGGCASGSAHVDLTLRAFKALYNVNVGLVTGLQASIVSSPVKGKWTSKYTALYGPRVL